MSQDGEIYSVSQQIEAIKAYIRQNGFQYPESLIENFYLSLKAKPFVILAGVSGTGKTKLVKLFAEALGATSQNGQFTLIPVRPDWSDSTDLLGYRELSGSFRIGKLTEVLFEALNNQHKPYFVCLDEMNLARVEHYFSDLLSIMETEQWDGSKIVTNTILSTSLLPEEDRDRLGSIHFPENVYIIGTVNMDETTYPFSKKVLDRANTIEFNYIDLDSFPDITSKEALSQQIVKNSFNSFLKREFLILKDAYIEFAPIIRRITEKLVVVNHILEQIHAHIGYRVRDSFCFYMVYNEQFQLMSKDDAFDFQFLQKILPRIQGSSSSVKRVLIELMLMVTKKSGNIEEWMNDPSSLYELEKGFIDFSKIPYPRSAKKISYMLRRLDEDGFTSYWLS